MRLPKILNETSIRGDDLRRLVQRAYSSFVEAPGCKPQIHFVVQIKFVWSSDACSQGWIWIGSGEIEIHVGRGFAGRPWEVREIAQILEHELDHATGAVHRNMPKWETLPVRWSRNSKMRLRKGFVPHFYRDQAIATRAA
jgi:hypothetical protein